MFLLLLEEDHGDHDAAVYEDREEVGNTAVHREPEIVGQHLEAGLPSGVLLVGGTVVCGGDEG